MTHYGGKIEEILHELSRSVAFSCRFRRCSDHRIASPRMYIQFVPDNPSENESTIGPVICEKIVHFIQRLVVEENAVTPKV